MKLTKGQKEFIGTTFPTPRGGVLTVTGVVGKSGRNVVFGMECSICSRDEELWPEGSIRSMKCTLLKGSISCGCSKRPRWTEHQTKIRVERECRERGFILNGWASRYAGTSTRLDLYNPTTGNSWKSSWVVDFLRGSGDPVDKTIPDEQHIERFLSTGKFKEGTKFWRGERPRSEGGVSYWNYHCPVCSVDSFVEAGVCTGVFKQNTESLKAGTLSCRCGGRYHLTQEQRNYLIQKTCTDEGLILKGWSGILKNHRFSKVDWECNKGHNCSTNVMSFLNGIRCRECVRHSGSYNGYYPPRSEEQDNLYLIRFKPQNCIKVGRAFDVEVRLKGNRGLLKISGCTRDEIEILQVLTGTHQEVYETEQWLQEELTERGFYHEESTWTTETFDEDCLQLLYKLVDESGLVDGEW